MSDDKKEMLGEIREERKRIQEEIKLYRRLLGYEPSSSEDRAASFGDEK